jgi:hypothetical protein
LAAGSCAPFLRAFERSSEPLVRKMIVNVLFGFTNCSSESIDAALTEMAEGDVVEMIVRHLSETGGDAEGAGAKLLLLFVVSPACKERVCAPDVADQIVKWSAEALQKVRLLGRRACNPSSAFYFLPDFG